MENKNNPVQTPKETEQALESLSDKLEEMDKAEGVIGEAMLEEDLDAVAGGAPTIPPDLPVCPFCHHVAHGPYKHCPYGAADVQCPYVHLNGAADPRP